MTEATTSATSWRRKEEGQMSKRFTFDDYKAALKGAGPKLTENILDRAAADTGIDGLTWAEFKALCDLAYPGLREVRN